MDKCEQNVYKVKGWRNFFGVWDKWQNGGKKEARGTVSHRIFGKNGVFAAKKATLRQKIEKDPV
jgi:hypothetical protein